jgi:hypothetical protein
MFIVRHDVRPQRADVMDQVADNLVASPFLDHFFGVEGVPVVDRAREVLFRAVEAVGGQQLGRAQHTDDRETVPARSRFARLRRGSSADQSTAGPAMCEQREQRVVFVVRVRRHLLERAGDIQPSNGEAQRHMAAVLRDDREGHPVLRVDAEQTRAAAVSAAAIREGSEKERPPRPDRAQSTQIHVARIIQRARGRT